MESEAKSHKHPFWLGEDGRISDTHPEIRKKRNELLAQLPVWRKMEMMGVRIYDSRVTNDEVNRRLAVKIKKGGKV
ncbi:MAG: hypothetical protein QNJ45_20485 [Ardenticatenaceae bacterium]|nr:hypothetical protein [Ardenticatenaceae bacterium]